MTNEDEAREAWLYITRAAICGEMRILRQIEKREAADREAKRRAARCKRSARR